MIVYCANIGIKDPFHEPTIKHEGVEYVYFVDDKSHYRNRTSSIWDIREVPIKFNSRRMTARWYKMHPHLLFPGEDTVWTDSNFLPRHRSPVPILTKDLDVFAHGTKKRDCLYQEAAYCLQKGAGNAEDIKRQVAAYRAEGMPEHAGLWVTSQLWRSPDMAFINDEWWKQLQEYSNRDQISLPYLIWKHDVSYRTLKFRDRKDFFWRRGPHYRF
jgi:hypothetical protein